MADLSLPAAGVEIALSHRSHERIGHRRTDDSWLAEQWASPRTRVLVMAGGRFPVTERGEDVAVRWLSPAEADRLVETGDRVLLGERGDVVHFALLARDFRAPDDWGMLRSHGPRLAPDDQGLAVQAQALAEWHRGHRHCGRCGGVLRRTAGGYVSVCAECGRQHFPRTDPAVIMLVIDEQDRALLGRQPAWPSGRWSTLAGFVDPGESLEDAVRREVMEEAGVEVGEVVYFGNQPWPFPSSLMVGFLGRATTTDIHLDDDELESARWFTREEIAAGAESGELVTPGEFSISGSLLRAWYGGQVPGSW
jgi:NAD+ diphosphatase